MSAKTDDAIQSIQNIIAKGMPHKDEMYAVQGYCDMLKKEIAELEDEVDNRREDMNTIIPQQDEEIEQLNKRLAVEHHRANVGWERALAWKATATKLADQQARHLNLQNHDRVETLTPEEILHNSGAPEEDA